jgi:hypothetical protein
MYPFFFYSSNIPVLQTEQPCTLALFITSLHGPHRNRRSSLLYPLLSVAKYLLATTLLSNSCNIFVSWSLLSTGCMLNKRISSKWKAVVFSCSFSLITTFLLKRSQKLEHFSQVLWEKRSTNWRFLDMTAIRMLMLDASNAKCMRLLYGKHCF